MTYTGSALYSASTGLCTSSFLRKYKSITTPAACSVPQAGTNYDTPACDRPTNPAGDDYVGIDMTVTKTQQSIKWDYSTRPPCLNIGSLRRTWFGAVDWALTVEDTESDAIARATAGGFGSWITAGAGGCTGTPPSCCLAAYQSRTTGFSFAYAETEWRMNYAGLIPGRNYTTTISAMRRPYGSGSYALYQSITVGGSADGSGNLTFTGTTPNERGFETYVACP